MGDLTQLLATAQAGDRNAWDRVYRIAGPRLRSIATHLLQRETTGSMFQPTALIGESWLRISRARYEFQSRWHFYNFSARTMMQTLVDAARRSDHRIGRHSVSIDDFLNESSSDSRVFESFAPGRAAQVRLTFERLRKWDAKAAETLWLRFVEGFTTTETARYQNRSEFKVREDCDFALKWMADQLR